MNHRKLYYIELVLISATFFVPSFIHINLGTYPGAFDFFSIFMTLLLALLTSIYITITNLKKNHSVNCPVIIISILLLIIIFQFIAFKPSYTAPFLAPVLILFLVIIFSTSIQNAKSDTKRLILAGAIGILINDYNQIIQSTLQLIHFIYAYTLIIYQSNNIYQMSFNYFELPGHGRITGSIGQPNELADMLSWGILANVMLFNKPITLHRIIFWMNLTLFSLFIAISGSRTAYLYPFVLSIYSISLYKSDKDNPLPRKLFASIVLLIVILVIYKLLSYGQSLWHHTSAISPPITTTSVPQPSSNATISILQRYNMWGKAWEIFLAHPWFGVGWNQISKYYLITPLPTFIPQVSGQLSGFANCHNLILQILATTGIVGVTIIFGGIGLLIYRLWKKPIAEQLLPLGVFLIVLTHSMFEYPLFATFILFPVILLLSINKTTKIIVNGKIITALILIFCTVGILILINSLDKYLLLSGLKKPIYYHTNQPVRTEIARYQELSTNLLWDDYADYTLAANLTLTSKTPENAAFFELLKQTMERVSGFQPHPFYLLKLAAMELEDNEDQAAKANISLVLNSYPGFYNDFIAYTKTLTAGNPKLYAKMHAIIRTIRNNNTNTQ